MHFNLLLLTRNNFNPKSYKIKCSYWWIIKILLWTQQFIAALNLVRHIRRRHYFGYPVVRNQVARGWTQLFVIWRRKLIWRKKNVLKPLSLMERGFLPNNPSRTSASRNRPMERLSSQWCIKCSPSIKTPGLYLKNFVPSRGGEVGRPPASGGPARSRRPGSRR